MKYLILVGGDLGEFGYQALDLCRLLDASIESSAKSDLVKNYLGDVQTVNLNEASGYEILAFRELNPTDLKSISEDNHITYFSEGSINAVVLMTSDLIKRIVTFGSRSAYKVSNIIKSSDIEKPVYKITPWVSIEGITKYEKPPFGKISSADDMGLRSMLRLMAAGAIVVVPNRPPFTDIIVNGWNGVIFHGNMDEIKPEHFSHLQSTITIDEAMKMAKRSEEMVATIMNKTNYISAFEHDIINGHGFDYCESWTRINPKSESRWIIPKQVMSDGQMIQIPAKFNNSWKVMRPIALAQLLDYLTGMRFRDVFVFDALTEEIDDQEAKRIERLLGILGSRAKRIHFCLDTIPQEWNKISHKLSFMSVAEGIKQIS